MIIAKWSKYIPQIATASAVMILAVAIFSTGYFLAKQKYQLIIKQMEIDKANALVLSANAYAAELKNARKIAADNATKTAAAGEMLAMANASNKQIRQKYKQGINHAVEQDKKNNDCINGLGNDSLRLYRQALGYTD